MIKHFLQNEGGNISIIFAMSLLATLLGIGTVVDISLTHSKKASMQDALDHAVLIAALNNQEANFQELGSTLFYINFDKTTILNPNISFNIEDDKMVGKLSGYQKMSFAGILPRSKIKISVRSVASISSPASEPCIISLSQNRPGIIFNGGTVIEGEGCEIHSHTRNGNGAVANSGIDIDVEKTCIRSSRILNNSNGQIGNFELNCEVAPDPYAGVIPVPTSIACDFNNGNYNNDNVTLVPGVYCGWHNFNNSNANVTFEPGLYILRNGGWNVNGGTWTGEDVTFYFNDRSAIQFNSGVLATMSAPVTGNYAGIFMTEREGLNRRNFIINDTRGFDFEGDIYLPSKDIVMNGGATVRSRRMKIIANTINFSSSVLSVEADPNSQTGKVIAPYLLE